MDYSSPTNVFNYGQVVSPTPAAQALMAVIVTETSRVIDEECSMNFGPQTQVNQVVRPQIDPDNLLTAWLPVPTINTVSALSWKLGTTTQWTAISDLTQVETENRNDGSVLRLITPTFQQYRGNRIQARVSYTSGWANLTAVPADFEFLTRRLCWWEYKKIDAPMDKTAMPALGVVIVPQGWPQELRRRLRPYTRNIPI